MKKRITTEPGRPSPQLLPAPNQSQELVVTLPYLDRHLLERIRNHPKLLKTLDPRDFEKLLAELIAYLGYEVELQRGTKDGGIDLFFLRRDPVMGPLRHILQAKRYKNGVGVECVRELLFLHNEHRVTKSCLATTSYFTRGAWKLANSHLWELELRDFDGLLHWLDLAKEKGPS